MARVAVVTGGTRGIGAAISKALKAAGYNVAASYAGRDEVAQKFSAETGRVLFLYTPAKAGGFFEERLRRPEELDPNGAEANQMRRRHGWDIIGPPPL